MSGSDARERLTEDARFELSLAAVTHERRNRPRGLVIAAAAAVALAMVFAGFGLSARGAARADLQNVVRDQAAVEMLAVQLAELTSMEHDSGSGRIGRPIPDLISRMERLATQAGLTSPRPPRTQQEAQRGNVMLRKFHYGEEPNQVTSPTMGPLLEWLRLATSDELGLEIEALNVKPDANNWRMTVTFRRLERSN